MSNYRDDAADYEEQIAQDNLARRNRNKLGAHPDCRDPEHPQELCPICGGDDDE